MTPDKRSRCGHLRRGHRGAINPKIRVVGAVTGKDSPLSRSGDEIGLNPKGTITEIREIASAVM